ncbi:MAG: 50S ribosomal protein L18 [Haliscomenobacter sp.]|uniref:Large ribosomal subunit protein uL18 n=1 Tax=Haliscomenobacter hydrossis (strain ATCC 27775 / DSM 1100 / LMG 10767 / O) TaxID=760192 RepID=F4KXT3_HALH1|nr:MULTISPECIES: 50S ribosomal protein L18 [Haliscomenobacter]AEE52592.1 ribosomal protein L18 [Haliscomenobacter hydrossis DSM 1100]MBK9491500.1 50S ribosomal protein L18 [Haliscomenobacter sp.]HPH18878.1 50S ribosomal protein L18 [Haliscomenobacter sp.]
MQLTKANRRRRIHNRVRKKITGTPARPRLTVFRSNKSIYAQIIDDLSGHTIVSASSIEAAVEKSVNKSEQAKAVGKILAERAVQANISAVVFDRGGYLYHGRVKALADGAREAGLSF